MKILLSLCVSALFSLNALAGEWTTDYNAALAQAKTDNKKVLLDFTGSDWCGFCKLLDQEVFSTPTFKEYADKNFVLVTIDFPRQSTLPSITAAQNARLKTRFGIHGYPTLVVVDPQLEHEITRKVGYQPHSGPAVVIAELEKK